MDNVKKLIRRLQSLPTDTLVVGYDIRLVDKAQQSAMHLFDIDVKDEPSTQAEEPRRIGF
jgi:hypothetical protein